MANGIKSKNVSNMTHIIKSLAVLALGAMLLTSCGKDNKDNEALIGKWTNTAQSYEVTISGREDIPEGCICMEFTDDKVWVSDSRTDCYATWNGYTLTKKDGKQLLEIDGGCYKGRVFVVEKLTSDELVLAPFSSGADWDFRYIMKRHEASAWPK
jgi:hypothetical protein